MDPDPASLALVLIPFLVFSLSSFAYAFLGMLGLAIVRARESQIEEMFGAASEKLKEHILSFVNDEDFYRTGIDLLRVLALVVMGASAFSFFQSALLQLELLELVMPLYFLAATVLVLFVLSFPVLMIMSSRSIALNAPEHCVAWFGWSVRWSTSLMAPLIKALLFLHKVLVRSCGFKFLSENDAVISSEELSELVKESREAGELEEDESELLEGVLEFSETIVSEVMTPRKDVVTLDIEDELRTVLETIEDAGYSRLLVIEGELDNVQGLLLVKDLLPFVGRSVKNFELASLLRKPMFIPGKMPIDDLMQEFRRNASHFAVVLDEHGGVDGVVTLEDVLEELTGEIFDEHDAPEEEELVRETGSGDLLVDGASSIDDLNETYGLEIPESEEYDTFAGYLIHCLGRIPEVGEKAEAAGLNVTFEQVEQNRIVLVRIHELISDSEAA